MAVIRQREENESPLEHERQPGPAHSAIDSGAPLSPVLTEQGVIDGEITRIDPPEPKSSSSASEQQVDPSEITIEVAPDAEPPVARPRKPYYLMVVITIAICLAVLTVLLLVPLLTPTAIVTIVPVRRDVSLTTTLSLQGRVLGPLTLVQSSSVPATGHQHQNAEAARGAITFFNGLLIAQTIDAGTVLTGSDSVQVITDAAALLPAGNPPIYGQVTVPAHAVLTGPQGNIRSGDIHNACCATSVVAENLEAFTGGQTAREYTVVTWQDIAAASSTLKTSLNQAAQGGLAIQARSDEAALTLQCHITTQADHQPGAEATIVQVAVTVTCEGLAYAKGSLEDAAQWALAQQAVQRLGPGYSLLSTVQVSIIQASFTGRAHGMATVQVKAVATYVYQITPGEVASIKHLIAGMSGQQAVASLLQLTGIQGATVNAATVPADPNCIQIVIVYP